MGQLIKKNGGVVPDAAVPPPSTMVPPGRKVDRGFRKPRSPPRRFADLKPVPLPKRKFHKNRNRRAKKVKPTSKTPFTFPSTPPSLVIKVEDDTADVPAWNPTTRAPATITVATLNTIVDTEMVDAAVDDTKMVVDGEGGDEIVEDDEELIDATGDAEASSVAVNVGDDVGDVFDDLGDFPPVTTLDDGFEAVDQAVGDILEDPIVLCEREMASNVNDNVPATPAQAVPGALLVDLFDSQQIAAMTPQASVDAASTRDGFATPRETPSHAMETRNDNDDVVASSDDGTSVASLDPEDPRNPWRVVGRDGRPVPGPVLPRPALDPSIQSTIRSAVGSLGVADRRNIQNRYDALAVPSPMANETDGNAPPVAVDKGKKVDPRERGEPILKLGGGSSKPRDEGNPFGYTAEQLRQQERELNFWNSWDPAAASSPRTSGLPTSSARGAEATTSAPKAPVVGSSKSNNPFRVSSHPNDLNLHDIMSLVGGLIKENNEQLLQKFERQLSIHRETSEPKKHVSFTPEVAPKEEPSSIRLPEDTSYNSRTTSLGMAEGARSSTQRYVPRKASRPDAIVSDDSHLGKLFQKVRLRKVRNSVGPSSDYFDPGDGGGGGPPSRGTSNLRRGRLDVKAKVEKPKVWDGSPKLEVFNRWTREGLDYLDDLGTEPYAEVRTLARFTEGKAQDFYQSVVADDIDNWDLERYLREVFNACFPPDFRQKQRRRLETCYQNDMSVKEFAAHVRELANSIGSMDERQVIIHLWRGLNPALTDACGRARLNSEDASWDEVIAEAENEEVVLRNRARGRGGEQKGKGKPNSSAPASSSSQSSSSRLPKQNTSRTDNRGKPQSSGSSGASGNGSSASQNRSSRNDNGNRQPTRASMSPQERQRLQSEGKCFTCKQPGHLSRNCPKNNTITSKGARPPGLRVNNIDFAGYVVDEYVPEDGNLLDLNMLGDHELVEGGNYEAIGSDSEVGSVMEDEADMVDFDFVDERWLRFLTSTYPDGRVGDASANTQTWMLELGRELGFVGDEGLDLPLDALRFAIDPISEFSHCVWDRGHEISFHILSSRLRDPKFNICEWYNKKLSSYLGIVAEVTDIFEDFEVNPIEFNTRACLTAVLGDPNQPGTSFDVSLLAGRDDVWRIVDLDSLAVAEASGLLLLRDRVDLVGWFLSHASLITEEGVSNVSTVMDVADLRGLTDPNDGGMDRALDALAEMLVSTGFFKFGCYFPNTEDYRAFDIEDCEVVRDQLALFGVQIDRDKLPAVQRNAVVVKDEERTVPGPVVVTVKVNGKPARALLDTGSLGDFMSTTLADQLGGASKIALEKPIPLQLAVQGSRSKINYSCRASLEYQDVSEDRDFDVININGYDLILGTPWMFQHRVMVGLNPARVVIGSTEALPLEGPGTTKVASMSMVFEEDRVERAREELMEYAKPLCLAMEDTPFPPFRAINHEIPLIDVNKVYKWRPSRCPEPLKEQWIEKKNAYLNTGRWKVASVGNAVPMMHVYKPGTKLLRVVVDLRERNANTRKMSTPMPDIEGILRRAASHKYRSLGDLKSAYEQVPIVPEHVNRTAMATPDGTMLSLVMQQGDCNAPATFQALMNHIFAPYIGKFMDVYLDDIIVYSNTIEEHVRHVKLIIDVLTREKLYLAENKLHFFAKELKILGHIVDDDGIRMDPHKVDSVVAWKTPTNRDLLRGFLGSVGFLADDCAGIRVPMGVLSGLTGDKVPFRWGPTHQRAFDEVKLLVERFRAHSRRPLDYSAGADPIWLITDASATGVAGVVSQGKDWRTSRVAAFYSAKLNSAQQNYPVHERELLAGLESMVRHRDILQGAKFTWLTDHKGLEHILTQPKMSGRQARWMETLNEFDFVPLYIPGEENVLSDALSRLYSNEDAGIERAVSEYTVSDEDSKEKIRRVSPVLTGNEARMESLPLEGVSIELNSMRTARKRAEAFAKRMRGKKFVLHGPRERTEGAREEGEKEEEVGGGNNQHVHEDAPTVDLISDVVPVLETVEPDITETEPNLIPSTDAGNFRTTL
ncbi:hypothetical protein ONZ45_g18448 [Pleurotus djamor]|nr:hypothetical protein ONZ45_g18448 [Pleurotus djamor]